MTRKTIPIALALCAMLLVVPAIAWGETKTLVSEESNSLCVNPTAKSFAPEIKGKPNYKPLKTKHKGAFKETAKDCAEGTASHPTAMAGPGQPAFPYSSSIPGASWVSINATGEDASNPAPRYYIYNAKFTLCQNQVATAKINGEMFADNVGGVFLNGTWLGNQTPGLPATNHQNFNGTPFPFSGTGAPGGFTAGLNTLQFVVLDESTPYTALDFAATVTTEVPCEPWWYSNGKLLKEGEKESVTTTGVTTAHVGETSTKCKVKDVEQIENPVGGGAGVDLMQEYIVTGCAAKPSPCPAKQKVEIIAHGLPWHTHLVGGPPIRDVIEGIELEVLCSGKPLDIFTGTLSPLVGNSVLEYDAGSGSLFDPLKNPATFTGSDKLKGPPGDEKITAK